VRVRHLAEEARTAEQTRDELLRLQTHVELPKARLHVAPIDEQSGSGEGSPVEGVIERLGVGAIRQDRRVGEGTGVPDLRAAPGGVGARRGLQPRARSLRPHHEDHFVVAVGQLVTVGAQHVGGRGVGGEAAALERASGCGAAVGAPIAVDVRFGDLGPQAGLLEQGLGDEGRIQ
jgi:hypothetical protein